MSDIDSLKKLKEQCEDIICFCSAFLEFEDDKSAKLRLICEIKDLIRDLQEIIKRSAKGL